MKLPEIPANEKDRLEALREYEILDTESEKSFDDITNLASEICDTPISLVSLVDQERQWFKSKVGLDATQTSREIAFCAHAILEPNRLFEIQDATKDERFIDNPLVQQDPNIRFYAGVPLTDNNGFPLGTLCVIDRKPKKLNDFQKRSLDILAKQVIQQLELRKRNRELRIVQQELLNKKESIELLNDFISKLIKIMDLKGIVQCIIEYAQRFHPALPVIYMINDEDKRLELISPVPSMDPLTFTKKIAIDKGPIKDLIDKGESGFVDPSDTIKNSHGSSVIFTSLISEGKVIGGMLIANGKDDQFGENHLEFYSSLANLASTKIRNAFYREEIAKNQLNSKQSEERHEKILNSALDAVVTINNQGMVMGWNPQAEELFGYTRESVLNKRLSELIIPEQHREAHEKGMRHFNKTGEGPVLGQRIEISAINKAKEEFPVELTVIPVKMNDEHIFTAFLRDISIRIKAETELKESLERQKQLTEMKSRFVSMTSHEFRTPLTTISSNIELLMYQLEHIPHEKKDKLDKNFNRILGEINRLTSLMNDILVLGRIESGKIPFRPIQTDIIKFCQEIISERFSREGDGRMVEFSYDGEPQNFVIDNGIYTHIFSNLLSNAFKYSKGKGNPKMRLKFSKDHFEIKVVDEGLGIPKEEQPRIFETFNRATNVENIQGTGLGLSIVKQFVNMHEGKVKFESEENKGSIFTVYQPLILEENEENSSN